MQSLPADNPAAVNQHHDVIDWASALDQHRRWLRTVVRCRVEDVHAVDDVMQEVALATLTQSLRPTDPGRVAPWLYRVAVRQAISHRRRQHRDRKLIGAVGWNGRQVEECDADPRDWVLNEEVREAVSKALLELCPQDRQILLLKYTEQWGYRQLAEHLGVGRNAVEYRLLRAKKRLRTRLRNLGREGTER